ncbi:MAG TPA: ABC transporter permease [Candidatus Omnitrophota bacterium]|nr:ABC transporter permease [Candidatus Omnitrophota bacterium]HQO57282.1 ABC transporter permease [Candidatus Omnitrophota bacterium]HQP11305.1 ABC transporter permease [Candidatus Omnitrophota bacterium]
MILKSIHKLFEFLIEIGNALFFLGEVLASILTGRVRWGELLKQIYEQGIQSIVIVGMTSFACGAVLALQGYVMLNRFGTKEYVAHLVVLSLVRELSPVFTSFIFSGKAGARMAAELGTMNVNDQILATRTMGVDPVAYLVLPRMLASMLVLPLLVVFSEVIGIAGGYMIGVCDANIPSSTYIHQTLRAVHFVDFFSGFIKTVFFSVIVSWVCCYQGYRTTGGSLGVGRYTTRAVAYSYMFVVLSNTVLTKIILAFWG